jgi:hypothetical protein
MRATDKQTLVDAARRFQVWILIRRTNRRDKHHDYPFRCGRRAAHRHLPAGESLALGELSTAGYRRKGWTPVYAYST